jgi:hypothetical protein
MDIRNIIAEQLHLSVRMDEGDRGPEDNEASRERQLDPMFGDEETAPQSEREGYHYAH